MNDTHEAWGGAIGTRHWEITHINQPTEGMARTSSITYMAAKGKLSSIQVETEDAASLKEGDLLPEHLRP